MSKRGLPRLAVILKGYPRLSETFIAQELLGLENAGFDMTLVSMRHPTDKKRHPVHDEIQSPVRYLPEYLHHEPLRVLRGLWHAMRRPGFRNAFRNFIADFRRDRTRNRVRRFGQAAVLAAELPDGTNWLHAHFIHTPASVVGYASDMTGLPWSCSAHAKDIWISPDWELAGKLASMQWGVTCTRSGLEHLQSLGGPDPRVHLSYHGLDLTRFAAFDGARAMNDGSDANNPVRLLSVGRAVEKKGYDVLLQALKLLPPDLHWRLDHVGGGILSGDLKEMAKSLGLADRITWHGALAQEGVLQLYRQSDVFALACRVAPDGDRDGLPNVLVEASSQGLVCVSTDISGVPELLTNGQNGIVVPPEDAPALARGLELAIRDPILRKRLGTAAERRVRGSFDFQTSVDQLTHLFQDNWQLAK